MLPLLYKLPLIIGQEEKGKGGTGERESGGVGVTVQQAPSASWFCSWFQRTIPLMSCLDIGASWQSPVEGSAQGAMS